MTNDRSSNSLRAVWRVALGVVATVALGLLFTRYGVVYGEWFEFDFRAHGINPVTLDRVLACVLGLVLALMFPEIWAVVPLLAASLDVILFVREIATTDATMWPFGLFDRLVWILCAYVGAWAGIVYVRSKRAS